MFFGVVFPNATILLFNLAVFCRVLYRLCTTSVGGNAPDRSKSKQQTIKRLQNAFAMTVLMGLTWVFGFFAIGDSKLVFSSIFCFCNSFQGLVLFLLFCARRKDVKKTLRSYMRRLCCKSCTPSNRSQTPCTPVRSSKSPHKDNASAPPSKSPNSDMDSCASVPSSKSPYSDMGFIAFVPMSTLSTGNNLTYDTTEDVMEQIAVPEVIAEIKEAEVLALVYLSHFCNTFTEGGAGYHPLPRFSL